MITLLAASVLALADAPPVSAELTTASADALVPAALEAAAPAPPPAAPLDPPPAGPTGSPAAPDPIPEAQVAEEIVVEGQRRDTLRELNRGSFEATQAVDGAVFGPLALGYSRAVPRPVRTGLRNVLYNLREPLVALNFLLQLKPGKAFETLGRFGINSTLGFAGLIDVAKRPPFCLHRRANGFADTLGYYGVKPGAFLFLPLVGPTTVRDLFGDTLDRAFLPLAVGGPFRRRAFVLPATAIGLLDRRAESEATLAEFRRSGQYYADVRAHYLAQRQREIDGLRGRGQPQTTRRIYEATAAAETDIDARCKR